MADGTRSHDVQTQLKELQHQLQQQHDDHAGQLAYVRDNMLALIGHPTSRWYQGLVHDGVIRDWQTFVTKIHRRFGPSEYDDPAGSLIKLTQTGSVFEYQATFEGFSSKVSDLSPGFLKSTFISGLKARIRRAVVAQRLRDFHVVFALARVFKEQFAEEHKLPIRRLTPTEIQLHREKGLCYNCDEKFVIGHRCKGKSTLLYLEGLDDDIESDQPPKDTTLSDPEISYKVLFGQRSSKSLRLQGADVVLGVHWLETLGPIITNYAEITMAFQWEDRKVVLHGDPNLCARAVSPSQFHKLMAHNNVSSCFMCLYVVLEQVTNISEQSHIHPVFHCSLLKPFYGVSTTPIHPLLEDSNANKPCHKLLAFLSERTILRQGVPVREVLVQWEHLPLEDASWEPWDDALLEGLEDKAISHGVGSVTNLRPKANSSQQPADVSDGVATRTKHNLRMPARLLD
ncbi:hypothetical protein Patl1_25459 [Pistacia atlantica]|uniref:Uncharacterized protein n=1 Tax=Pistacia atlantica TaxID=434234 RepID=A0ACC1B0N7_9ROSI|nr:hypothetical protein Patl1_25459 [Pistacia atlantica]